MTDQGLSGPRELAPEKLRVQFRCDHSVTPNVVICWHTEYMGLAVDELCKAGRRWTPRRWRTFPRSSAVNYFGLITLDHELAQLDERRPDVR
ncbi:hypothetical protein [Streptomyces sp. NPDC004296]|uniref:hypothetical protein n=1 Tax=Streptomyces sp. NPDC004296 TaxID=3364697 RepID=UPI00368AB66F